MEGSQPGNSPGESEVIRVRYWAAARAAAGTSEEQVDVAGPLSLAELTAALRARHPDRRFADVLGVCSTLVGEQPVGSADPATVELRPGDTVEFLPPFAGG